MLHNTRPMEYASSLGYYNYQNYNAEYGRESCNVAYNPAANGSFQDVSHNATFYQPSSKLQDTYPDKISKYATESPPDFNANVVTRSIPNATSPPAYSANNPIKPALPTFPWMNYSSEDGNVCMCYMLYILLINPNVCIREMGSYAKEGGSVAKCCEL